MNLYIIFRRRQNANRRPSNQRLPPPIPPELREGQFVKPYEMESQENLHNMGKHSSYGPRPGDRNEYAHIWEMPLPQPKSPGLPPEGGDRPQIISAYGYRSSGQGTYGTPATYDQSYGNSTMARKDFEHEYEVENGDDPRYFQLDPEVPPSDH